MTWLIRTLAVVTTLMLTAPAAHADIATRDGWVVIDTGYAFPDMVERLNTAVKAADMGLVTRASASAGAEGRGITIPGNMIVGVYRNDFAVRMLEASVAAGIEAPVRFYLAERDDGGTTLSYKTPTTVFAPYFDEGGDALREMAAELDAIFEGIAAEATAG